MSEEQLRVLVTGASSGIGRAVALQLAREGFMVIATARREERLQELQKIEPEIEICVCDLTRDLGPLKKILEKEPVDILINNAGLALGTQSLEDIAEADWKQMFETNVFALIALTQQVLPAMKKKGRGDIVNIGSVAGYQTYPGGSIYNATKFAVRALTEALRKDVLGYGIRVIGIHPGMVETEFSEVRYKGDQEKAAKVYENFRALKSEDIAESVVWSLHLPRHVNIESLLIMPTDQAAVGQLVRHNKE